MAAIATGPGSFDLDATKLLLASSMIYSSKTKLMLSVVLEYLSVHTAFASYGSPSMGRWTLHPIGFLRCHVPLLAAVQALSLPKLTSKVRIKAANWRKGAAFGSKKPTSEGVRNTQSPLNFTVLLCSKSSEILSTP